MLLFYMYNYVAYNLTVVYKLRFQNDGEDSGKAFMFCHFPVFFISSFDTQTLISQTAERRLVKSM